jgi:hypothetical protein
MRRRSRSERNAAKRKWQIAQVLKDADPSTGATGVSVPSELPQASGESEPLQSETAFKPEVLGQSLANGHGAAGVGEAVELARNRWDEIRAVKDRYPISRGMLERIAFEAIRVATSETASVRHRLIAIKLLWTMAEGNRPDKGLPPQIEIGIKTDGNRVLIRQLIDEMNTNPQIYDSREFKIVPGSPEDYAE